MVDISYGRKIYVLRGFSCGKQSSLFDVENGWKKLLGLFWAGRIFG